MIAFQVSGLTNAREVILLYLALKKLRMSGSIDANSDCDG
jgi:hypothetical protein